MHLLERLLSHVRHSVVRVCFYNLKLFCPSLVDEYDEHVREQVALNIDQLGAARAEIAAFFEQALSDGRRIAEHFPAAREKASGLLDELATLAQSARDQLDTASVRLDFAAKAPMLIDGVMDALNGIQSEFGQHRLAVETVLEQAIELSKPATDAVGLRVNLDTVPTPKVFGDARLLLNAFAELIHNAAKYSEGTELAISLRPSADKQHVEMTFQDNGCGMTSSELATCLQRGASSGGSGEGLPMLVEIVEAEHLGSFDIQAEPGRGCVATVRLPIKFNPRKPVESV